MAQFGMSSRYLHPVSCRLPRNERAAIVTAAASSGMTVSALLRAALRNYLGSPISVDPGVYKPSPEPPQVYLEAMFPKRQQARPVRPLKPEDRPECAALGRDHPDNIR
jgi:hypothetical protein